MSHLFDGRLREAQVLLRMFSLHVLVLKQQEVVTSVNGRFSLAMRDVGEKAVTKDNRRSTTQMHYIRSTKPRKNCKGTQMFF